MNQLKNTGFADRISTANEAKKAMLAKFQPKPTVAATDLGDREARRLAELEAVRVARVAERESARAARAAEEEAARQIAAAVEAEALEIKRNGRKERKQLERSEQQTRRAARLAAYMR